MTNPRFVGLYGNTQPRNLPVARWGASANG